MGAVIPDALLQGDCLDLLADVAPCSIDLVFADLPYGRTRQSWDRLVPADKLWERLHQICKPEAAMVFTAIQPFTSLLVMSNVENFRYEVIWKKNKSTGFLNAKKQPLRAHENIVVFYRKQPKYRPQMTTGHEPGHAIKGRLSTTGLYNAMPRARTWGGSTERYPTSVLEIPVINGTDKGRTHANQKPEPLVEWFIRTHTDPGDTVLDPTMGSGTTCAVAKRLGRRYVGIEKDAEIFERARERVENVKTDECLVRQDHPIDEETAYEMNAACAESQRCVYDEPDEEAVIEIRREKVA